MATSSEHATARIKVQVVATLLPLNIPVHVDPFWALIRFSESPTICDVENQIIACLNCMGEEYPAELVVHDSPITSSWTYLPTSSSTVQSGNHHQMTKSNVSDASHSEQQLTIVLRPHSRKLSCWTNKAKPPKPVLISYDISRRLPKSARLTFKTQLIFMHDSVLLSDSKSDILRDNDAVIINAICYFWIVKNCVTFEGVSCKQGRATSKAEFELNDSLWDLDKDSLFCDTEIQNRTNTEAKLSAQIRTKIDTVLKKLTSLRLSNQNEESSSGRRKSKKRKAEEDSRSESSRSESSSSFISVSGRIDAQVEEKSKTKERDIRSELRSTVVAVFDRVDAPVKRKGKSQQGDNDSVLYNSFVATPDQSNVEGEKHKNASVEHQGTQEQNSINSDTNGDNLLSKSKKKKKRSKKKVKCDVEVDCYMDSSMTQTTEEINQTVQASLNVNDKQEDVQVNSSPDMVASSVPYTATPSVPYTATSSVQNTATPHVPYTATPSVPSTATSSVPSTATPSVPSTATPSRRRTANLERLGLSSVLCALRKQQTIEISCNKDNKNSAINSQEMDVQNNENPESEKTNENVQNDCDQLNFSVTSPKKKRIRRRKKKNSDLDKSSSDKQIVNIVRDYTLKLPAHQMPQNNKLTFECDSDDDDDDDDATPTSTRQLFSQAQDEQKSVHQSMARSDITKTSSITVAGAPINPDKKFQALLHQCGTTGRQFETINSANGHTVIRSSRKKQRSKSAAGNSVAVGGDVLTNISMAAQEVKIPTSDSISHVQSLPTPVADNINNSSLHENNGRLNTISLITSTPEFKAGQSFVEVTPLYMNYSSCTQLSGLPKEADIIAYKVLELSEDYTPGISNFKEAKVIHVDANTGSLLLESRGEKDKKRLGRFELSLNDTEETASAGKEELVEVNLADLVDTRLVFRADGSQ